MATTFESMHLGPELVAACRKQGFRAATPIQARVIPSVMQGRDLVVEAKTGSGKTLAYGLPLLHAEPGQTQFPEALVVTPTRELASQVEAALTRSTGALNRRVVALVGRGGLGPQEAALEAGVQIVVGTMGRLEDLRSRGLLQLDRVRTLVLDEVDELLQRGFSEGLAVLLEHLPARRQTLLFSATIPQDVERVARTFMREPQRLQLSVARELPEELSHWVLRTTVSERVADLAEFLRAARPYQALLFCGTRHEADELTDALVGRGLEASALHGELSATKRRKLIEAFRAGEPPVLVATDLAARGLDLPGVELVVNYSLPEGPAPYLHRAGRTGRAGKPGVVVTMLIEQQHGRLEKLKQTIAFQKVEIQGGRVLVRPIKTREERDLEFRRLPRRTPKDVQRDVPSPEAGRPQRTARAGRGGPPRETRASRHKPRR